MSLLTLLIVIILVLALVGGLPQLGLHSGGYGVSGGIGLVLVILIILMLLGKI